MAYNKAREEKKWKQWKENEEKQMRKLGVKEDIIHKLHHSDWESFKEERRYQEHQIAFPDFQNLPIVEMSEPELNDVGILLDAIEDERLLEILLGTDRKTLRILLLKIMGYSVREIAQKLGMPDQSVYTKIRRLREKIKNNQRVNKKQ